MSPELALKTWRPRLASQVGLSVTSLLPMAISGVMIMVDGDYVFAIFPAATAVTLLLGAFATYISLFNDRLEVRNLGFKTRILLAHVEEVETTYWGIRVSYGRGEVAVGMAVQKSNAAIYSGSHTRADQVAEAIQAAATQLRN